MPYLWWIAYHADMKDPDPSRAADRPPLRAGAVLACVGLGAGGACVVRSAARLALAWGVPWHAVLVDGARMRRLPDQVRLAALAHLRDARARGATTSVLEDEDPAAAIAGYARRHGCAIAVLGQGVRGRWPWRTTLARRLVRLAPGLDLLAVAPDGDASSLDLSPAGAAGVPGAPPDALPDEADEADEADEVDGAPSNQLEDEAATPPHRYLAALAASLGTAAVALPLLPLLDAANVAMLFLLCVVLVAIRLGRGPAIVATLAGFAAFVPALPRRAYGAGEFRYAVALAVMLTVGWITARLTSDLRGRARSALAREARTRSLYEFARALSVALQTEQVVDITRRYVARTFGARGAILLPGADARLAWPAAGARLEDGTPAPAFGVIDMAAARWAFERGEAAGAGTPTIPGNAWVYLPLRAPMCTRGVLAIRAAHERDLVLPEQRELLDAFAALAAIALERVHYVDVARDAVVKMEGERLRNSLLAALSHDLRTPLTGLVGLSESLTLSRPALAEGQMELACALRDEARRMSTLVANLLDMARIQSGGVTLNLQWQFAEEVIGTALRACRWQLGARTVRTRVAPGLPLVRYDAVLIERVLCNLLENAAKYTPADAAIEIGAEQVAEGGGRLVLSVCDDGPGLPSGREDALFEKFVRGRQESPIAGVGLGLAICRAIVDAHGGRMRACNRDAGGARFELALPLGEPPAPPDPHDADAAIDLSTRFATRPATHAE